MAQYFFDTQIGDELVASDIALEFGTLDAVRDAAARALAEMAVDVLAGHEHQQLAVIVRDEQGNPLLRSTLRYDTRIEPQS